MLMQEIPPYLQSCMNYSLLIHFGEILFISLGEGNTELIISKVNLYDYITKNVLGELVKWKSRL